MPSEVVTVFELATLGVETPAASVAALSDDDAFGSGWGHNDLGGYGVRLVLDIEDGIFRETPHAAEENLGVSPNQHWTPRHIRVESFDSSVIEGEYVVARRLDQPQALQPMQLFGHLLGEVLHLAPVFAGVVELPVIVVECRDFSFEAPWRTVPRYRGPPLW